MRRAGKAVALVLAWGSVATATTASAADQAGPLFDPDAVATVHFDLPQESRDAINDNPNEYAPADMTATVAGQTFSLNDVGLRLRGSTSFRTLDGKASFKVKTNEFVSGQKILGRKKLTLTNMVQDPSMIHEELAYELFRGAGVPASRTGYADVSVNDE